MKYAEITLSTVSIGDLNKCLITKAITLYKLVFSESALNQVSKNK